MAKRLLIKISNTPRDYAWGSHTLIPDYFGLADTGKPMAEIWFGTHPSNSSITDDQPTRTLLERIEHQLPFLLKILAAGGPLSIQAHPNSQQAADGFARENAAGLAIDSPSRNYKDDKHKPEMLVALTDFEALVGFRDLDAVKPVFEFLADSKIELAANLAHQALQHLATSDPIKNLFTWLTHQRGQIDSEVAACVQALTEATESENLLAESELATHLQQSYPGDPGVLIALTMNHLCLSPKQGVFLPAGVVHAYLSGLGVEIMAASDNVLRGGLTPKHVDVDELIEVLNFESGLGVGVTQREVAAGLIAYPVPVDDFQLYRVEVSGENLLADIALPGESIVLCTAGEVAISNSKDERIVLKRGEAAFASGEAKHFTFAGSGTAFLATSSLG